MKPDNWGQMNAADKREMAMRLLNSQRGKLIVGKALAKAIGVMQYATYPEHSDMEDMEILGETLFDLGYLITLSEQIRNTDLLPNAEQVRDYCRDQRHYNDSDFILSVLRYRRDTAERNIDSAGWWMSSQMAPERLILAQLNAAIARRI